MINGPQKKGIFRPTGSTLLATALLFFLVACGLRLSAHSPIGDDIPCSRLIRSADGVILRLTLAWDGQYRLRIPLSKIAPTAVEAILLKEDRYFFLHPGVNPSSLVRAACSTYLRHQRQGGSTLTMQLARKTVPARHP